MLNQRWQVHFRALMRPHTDPTLGHCSSLNTCYSEPTYAMSPSIPSISPGSRPQNNASLPSGLGAGGRGKEKAPCRYLHFEVDYDPEEDGGPAPPRYHRVKSDGDPKLQIGFGPGGKVNVEQVSNNVEVVIARLLFLSHYFFPSSRRNGSTVMLGNLTTLS
jgi:hypothetical protein